MQGKVALFLRIFILYPLASIVGLLPSVTWDSATSLLIIDVNAASAILGAMLFAAVSGGTFGWSRLIKAAGGKT